MPFANYKDFDDCVAKNNSKGNPEGYCAAIQEKAESALSDILMSTVLKGAEILKVGSYQDSSGKDITFDSEFLAQLVENSKLDIPITLKLGHTSDEFTNAVAKALGVPLAVLSGDAQGKGAAKLGSVNNLSSNGILKADITFANDAVANLVKDGFFDNLSLELLDNYEFDGKDVGPVVTALSLLGAQIPAISDLPKLQQEFALSRGAKFDKLVLLDFKPGSTEFVDVNISIHEMLDVSASAMANGETNGDMHELLEQVGSDGFNISVSKASTYSNNPEILVGYLLGEERKMSTETKLQETEEEKKKREEEEEEKKMAAHNDEEEKKKKDLATIGQALNLTSEDSTSENILASIAKLSEQKTQSLTKLESVDKRLVYLERQERVHEFMKKTSAWTAISGTAEELALKLVTIEDAGGKDAAKLMFEAYAGQHKTAAELKLTQKLLNSDDTINILSDKKYEFDNKVEAFAKEKSISVTMALAQYSMDHSEEFMAYKKEKEADMESL